MSKIHINIWLSNKRQMLYSFIKNIESLGIDIFTYQDAPEGSRDGMMKAVAHINQALDHARKAVKQLENAKVVSATEARSRGEDKNSQVPT